MLSGIPFSLLPVLFARQQISHFQFCLKKDKAMLRIFNDISFMKIHTRLDNFLTYSVLTSYFTLFWINIMWSNAQRLSLFQHQHRFLLHFDLTARNKFLINFITRLSVPFSLEMSTFTIMHNIFRKQEML